MRKFFAFLVLAGVAVLVALVISGPPSPPPPPEKFGDYARRICRVEASPDSQSQKDCYDKKLLGKLFEVTKERYERALRDAESRR